jgi:hypothetical protein
MKDFFLFLWWNIPFSKSSAAAGATASRHSSSELRRSAPRESASEKEKKYL